MAPTTLEINVVSARDLSEVTWVSKMSPYVVVSLAGEYHQKLRTNADRDGGRNPNWNFPMKFTINHLAPRPETLVFTIRAERARGDRDVGEVHVAVPELLQSAGAGGLTTSSYPVTDPLGKTKGVLHVHYRIGRNEGSSSKVDPPPEPQPQPQHAQQQQQVQSKTRRALGLAAGLLIRTLGFLLVEDFVSDTEFEFFSGSSGSGSDSQDETRKP